MLKHIVKDNCCIDSTTNYFLLVFLEMFNNQYIRDNYKLMEKNGLYSYINYYGVKSKYMFLGLFKANDKIII